MGAVASFDIDLPAAVANGGALGAADELLRVVFGWNGHRARSAEALLTTLQTPAVQSLVQWTDDVVLSTPAPLIGRRVLIAAENQSCWQAAQNADGSVELGMTTGAGWETWLELDLADLLLRLLVTEAVVGHGPCLASPPLPSEVVRPFELLPPLLVADHAALEGVAGSDAWFGVTTGTGGESMICAAPVERARRELIQLAPYGLWFELP